MTWNSGVREGSRAGPIASMTASTGVSDQASASTTVRCTWSSRSMKDIHRDTRVRSTTVLTIMPSSGSISGRLRFAAPVPTSRSCCPVYRYSSAAKPGVHGREQRHPVLPAERAQRARQLGRHPDPRRRAAHAHHRRPRPVGRQLQQVGRVGQQRGPVVHVRPQHLAPHPLPLPDRVVRVLDRRARAAATAGRPRTPRRGSTARTAAPPATIHRGRSGAPRGRRCSRHRRGAAAPSAPAAAGSGRTACAARRRSPPRPARPARRAPAAAPWPPAPAAAPRPRRS